MNLGQPSRRPVWFILDELASLQRLPQLHTAITENRKSNNPVVLGFQGRSQLETRYGHDAEAMLSQPATKIFLRTSEPHAAKWIADTIGEVEIERLRESRSKGTGPTRQQSYGLERQVEPLVMASEISGLAALRGYLKLGNLVVRLHVPFLDLPSRHPAFIERPIQTSRTTTVPVAAPVESSETPAQRLTPRNLTQTPEQPAIAVESGARDLLPIRRASDADHLQALERGTGEAVSRRRVPERPRELLRGRRADRRRVAREARRRVGIERRRPRRTLSTAQRRTTPDHRRGTRPPSDRAHLNQRARRDGHDDGTSRGMGRDVLGTEDGVADGPGG